MKMGIEIPLHTSPSAICMFCISVAVKSTGVFSFNKSHALEKVFKFKGNSINTCTLYTSCEKKPWEAMYC